jgi:hypothetical protein
MEWTKNLNGLEPEDRVAVVWCEDERHAEESDVPAAVAWLFESWDDPSAGGVANAFWDGGFQCLDISVEVTTVGQFRRNPGSGEVTRFSIPLGDRLYNCESCRKEYAVRQPGVDPCPFCGAVPQ